LLYDLMMYLVPGRHVRGETMREYPVTIQCEACGARFRFDRSLVAGYRGASFRCRRCGQSIVASIPDEPSVLRQNTFSGIRANPREPMHFPNSDPLPAGEREPSTVRSTRSAPLAVPVAEEAPVLKPTPDNLVEFQRIRKTHRVPAVSGPQAPSDRISRYILASAPLCAETVPDVPPAETPARRITTDFTPDGQGAFLEEMFRWRDREPPKRVALLSSIRTPLLFIALGTALACLGFLLVAHLAR